MITHIKGKITEISPTDVVIDLNGIGYLAHISLNTFSKIQKKEEVFLYTHFSVKEDSQTLFGFADKSEREMFRLLISVSGIGPGSARSMLSSMATEEIAQAIMYDNVKAIQAAKGIGVKTAQRVIIDLKDKVAKIFDADKEFSTSTSNTSKNEALTALEVLGFHRKQLEKVVDQILLEDPAASVELIIKRTLKKI
jgi:Holliday junction DNA helicase RuvA